jgi:SAM-dependent methyltransferase
MSARAVLTLPVRGALSAARALRHRWLRLKPGRRVRRAGARAGGAWQRRLRPLATSLRQLTWYDVPGERRRCPACGAGAVRHLQALEYTRQLAPARRCGFVSGCARCGLVFANPLPTPEDLEHTYRPDGTWGRTRPDHEPPVSRDRLAALFAPVAGELDVLRPPAGAAVLDVGCGLGGMLDSLAALGWVTAGIDPGTKEAFERHRELHAVPAHPEFDLVILHHVLEHVIDPAGILGAVARATRPGGYLLVSVPNLDTLPQHGDLPYCIRSNTHVLAYTRDCLAWLLAAAGFRAISTDADAPATGAGSPRQVVLARREDGALPPTRLPVRVQPANHHLRRTGVLRQRIA